MPSIGDVKFSLTGTESPGWFRLNGQTITTQTPTARENAISVYGSAVLPDYSNRHAKIGTPGTLSGSESLYLTREQLPEINLPYQVTNETNTSRGWYVVTYPSTGTTYGAGVIGGGSTMRYMSGMAVPLNSSGVQNPLPISPKSVGAAYMVWLSIENSSLIPDPEYTQTYDMPEIGDVKPSILTTDHKGWFLLDGRDVNDVSITSNTTRDNLVALGYATLVGGVYTGALPDATDTILGNTSETTLGSLFGSNSKTLTEADLPEIAKPLIAPAAIGTDQIVTQTGGYGTAQDGAGRYGFLGPSINSFATSEFTTQLNTTGSQTAVDTRQRTFNVNQFMFLSM